MDVEELEFATLKSVKQVGRPLVLTTRRFRRSAKLGMKVWRSVTRNFDYDLEIEHIEIGCPGYELSNNGPVHKKKEEDDETRTDVE